jgi:hypothetical protein
MAWRGLAPDGQGNLFMVSEAACRIMKVEPDGDAEWEGPGLLELGVEMGLFSGENSGVEGIIVSDQGKYLVAAAREPRGLALDGESIYVVLDNKGVGRQADITDKRPLLLVFNRPAGV